MHFYSLNEQSEWSLNEVVSTLKNSKLQGMPQQLSLFFFITLFGFSQIAQSQTDISFEFQAYPTGIVPGVRISKLFQEQHAAHLRLGYNWIRHRDLGVHEDERGDGFGGSLGYRYYFQAGHEKWFAGARSDVWFNELSWKDNIGGVNAISGVSNIIVVQPTLETGYLFLLADGSTFVAPSLALGFEINVKTEGAEVGQGAILLVGISAGKRF